MRSNNQKTNRRLFLVLLGVLALNMPWSNNEGVQSTDLASSSTDLKKCKVVTSGANKGQRICKVTKVIDGKKVEWSFKTKSVVTPQVDLLGNEKGETTQIKIVGQGSTAGICESCTDLDELDFPSNNISDIGALSKEIDEVLNEKSKALIELAEQQKEEEKKRKEEEKKEEELAKKMDKCLVDSDGERLRGTEKLNCQIGRLDDMDEEEADRHFRSEIVHDLREYLDRGSPEQREEALLMIEDLRDMDYTTSISQSTRAMLHAHRYQKAVHDLAKRMKLTRPGTGARVFHSQQLMGLNKQMQYEFGQLPQYWSNTGRLTPDAYDEYSYWRSSLFDSIDLAMQDPSTYMDRWNTGSHSPVIDTLISQDSIAGRVARGRGIHDDLFSLQSHWDNLAIALDGMSPIDRSNRTRPDMTNTARRSKPQYRQRVLNRN